MRLLPTLFEFIKLCKILWKFSINFLNWVYEVGFFEGFIEKALRLKQKYKNVGSCEAKRSKKWRFFNIVLRLGGNGSNLNFCCFHRGFQKKMLEESKNWNLYRFLLMADGENIWCHSFWILLLVHSSGLQQNFIIFI